MLLRFFFPASAASEPAADDYGKASMFMKNLNAPVCCTPRRNCKLIEAPGASGVPVVIVPADKVEFQPPPLGCAGGVSNVVPRIVTVHGTAGEPGSAAQVAESSMPVAVVSDDVRARRSAVPGGAGKVVTSTIRKRSRVTLAPVLLTNLSRIDIVPNVELLGGSVESSRTRLGTCELAFVVSNSKPPIELLRLIGDPKFSGPGAPRSWPSPVVAPVVLTPIKSATLSPVSFGKPPVARVIARKKLYSRS